MVSQTNDVKSISRDVFAGHLATPRDSHSQALNGSECDGHGTCFKRSNNRQPDLFTVGKCIAKKKKTIPNVVAYVRLLTESQRGMQPLRTAD